MGFLSPVLSLVAPRWGGGDREKYPEPEPYESTLGI